MFPVMWAVGDLARRRVLCGALLQTIVGLEQYISWEAILDLISRSRYILGGHSRFNIGLGTRIITRVHALRERVEPFRYFGNEAADVL